MSAKKRRHSAQKMRQGAEAPRAAPRRISPWLFPLLVIAVGFFVYWPAVSGTWVLDDYDLLESGSPLRGGNVAQYLRTGRPVVLLSFAANYRLGGLEPAGFHLVNIAFHCLNALLLWRLLVVLFARTSLPERIQASRKLFVFGVPLLFLLSPIQTESVAYISSRTELLAVFFFLLGLLGFALFRDRRPWLTAGIVLACFVLTTLSKQDKLVLPAAVLLLDYLLLSACDWRGLRKSMPLYGLLTAGAIAGFVAVIRPILYAGSAGFYLEWQSYLFTQFRMYFRYVGQLIWPFGLNLDPHIQASESLLQHGSVFALAALLAAVAACIRWHRSAPLAVFGVLFFLLTLLPTTSFFPLLDFAAERRLYLPSIGFFIGFVSFASMTPARYRKILPVAGAVLLLIYGAGARQRSIIWSDDILLWQDTASKSPDKARPWAWLGRAYDARGLPDHAAAAWQRGEQVAREGSEEHASLLGNLGLVEARKKNYGKAAEYYRRALEITPWLRVPRAQLGTALIRLGQEEEGWRELDDAADGRRIPFEVRVLRAQELYLAERYAESAREYGMALFLFPESEETRRNFEVARRAALQAGQTVPAQ